MRGEMVGATDYMKQIYGCAASDDNDVSGYMSSYTGSCPTSNEPVNQYAADAGIDLTDNEQSSIFYQDDPFRQDSPFNMPDIRSLYQ